MDTLSDMLPRVSGSAGDLEDLTKKVSDLAEENEKLKKLYLKTHVDIVSMQTIMKSIAQNQAQLAADMHTIYTSVRDAGIMDAEYGDADPRIGPDSEDDDSGSSGGGGMGGMLN